MSRSATSNLLLRFWRFLWKAALALFLFSILWTLAYRWLNPPVTWLMVRNAIEGAPIEKDWASLDEMTPNLPYAAIRIFR